jgi:hypothetical protein
VEEIALPNIPEPEYEINKGASAHEVK